MAEILLIGSRGDEVRRLQRNLNAALAETKIYLDGKNILPLAEDGKFGRFTQAAVERFQRDYKLKKVDGKVGDETRKMLATRVVIISGSVSRNANPSPSPQPNPTPPPPHPLPEPVPQPPVVKKAWLFQAQPALGLTPPPFFTTDSILTAQLALGLTYRTAPEGPHWEFGSAFQPSCTLNRQIDPTDPRYTLQLQGSVAFADPYHRNRFHTQLFSQAALLANFAPQSVAVTTQLGGQISIDIVDDQWNLFLQGAMQGQWTLFGDSAGRLSLSPAFTLGTTIQWEIKQWSH